MSRRKKRQEEPVYTNIGGALNIFIPTAYLKEFQKRKKPFFSESIEKIVERAIQWGEKNVERPRRRRLLKELRERKRTGEKNTGRKKKTSGGGGI